jgi:N6-adenosine-specific RNA methylase IME4
VTCDVQPAPAEVEAFFDQVARAPLDDEDWVEVPPVQPRSLIFGPRAVTLEQVEAAGGFRAIYADPNWPYDQKVRKTLDEAHYATMSVERIAALPVRRLAAKDSALFLWCTWPHVCQGSHIEVARAWGFTLKTLAFIWVKRSSKQGKIEWGNGMWTRANTEPCFLATRGSPKRVDAGVHQYLEDFEPEEVLDAVRGRHSAKPAVVREKILKLLGDVPAIELFARDRAPNFNCWGLEAPGGSDVIMEV